MDKKHSLVDVADSLLILIDIQEWFLNRLEPGLAERLIKNAAFLIDMARLLDVPVVITAEEPAPTNDIPSILVEKLTPGTPVYTKKVFGLAGQADILQAVGATRRKTAVLVGLETDVCVAQSGIGLLENGYRVVALSDATASPGDAHEAGLSRMRDAGVLIASTKGLYYEWVRTVEQNHAVHKEYRERFGKPIEIKL